jgi:aminopeptidase-like protein
MKPDKQNKPDISNTISIMNYKETGKEMYRLIEELYPICRSITGNGVRETLRILKKHIPLTVQEVPSGTQVFDWTVPKEWNIKNAYVRNSKGEKIIDFNKTNLHVLNYSVPVREKVSLGELKAHLYTLPEYPEWIPYRTSYYKETWGFCMSLNQYKDLKDEEYEVVIDSSLQNGHLTYGEYYIKGEEPEEVLISCHICHPSLCNDNLSGIVIALFLADFLNRNPSRYSYRFLFIPGTIGSITWLCLNESKIHNIKHGLVAACLGDAGKFTYKKSRSGNAEIDRAVICALRDSGNDFEVLDFIPYGYDERQYCSPGFNLPVGCLMRTPYGRYPEYHTSADNLGFVQPSYLSDSFSRYLSVLNILENNKIYMSTNPKCEPQLGRRGLYESVGGGSNKIADQTALLWILNLSDGQNTLLDIAERSGIEFATIQRAARILLKSDLLKEHS